MTISIRKARKPDEIEAAVELVWEFFDFLRERYPDMLEVIETYIAEQDVAGRLRDFANNYAPPFGECFLAKRDGEAHGIVMLRPRDRGGAEMNRMYVRASARGHGIGRRLGEAVIEEARALGYDSIWLDALPRHFEALPLYESLGFRRYEIDGGDPRIIHMKLSLSAH